MVRIFLFLLITSIMCTKPYIFLFLLYRSYLSKKKNNLLEFYEFKHHWRDLRKGKRYFFKRNFGGGIVFVWSAFCSRRILPLSFTSSKMNSNDFVSVLDTHLFSFLKCFRRKKYIFQLDNAIIYISSTTS